MMSVLILRRSGYKIVFHWLFSLVFLAIWAGGIWIRPVGPSVGGVFFLPFVIVGFLVVISFLAFTKKDKPQGRVDTIDLIEKIQRKRDFEKISVISINIFFYFLLVFLISAVISKYILLK
jgi:hypothetical protein